MGATPAVLDMTYAGLKPSGKPLLDPQGRPPEKQGGRPAKSLSQKQIRARARRKQAATDEELKLLYNGRGIESWDAEELARGRPRAADGTFKGRAPSFIDRNLHEQIVKRFEQIVREEMNGHTIDALRVIGDILSDEAVDEKGKPRVPAGTKLEAAKFLVEHVIGKPKQRMETDISVKLMGILGHSMVNPSQVEPGGFELAQGYIDAESWEDDDDESTGD